MQHPLVSQINFSSNPIKVIDTPEPQPTLEAFRSFCASQPADKGYYYMDSRGCAAHQFAKSIDLERWIDKTQTHDSFWRTANRLAGNGTPTFGELTKRIDQQLALTVDKLEPELVS